MKAVLRKIEELKPYENNPRLNDSAVDHVASSISVYGFQQPIVVDKQDVIIVGHTRLKAAQKLGLDKVPVVVADMTPEQAKAYRLADNRTGEIATWDRKQLGLELADLCEVFDDMPPLGFSNDAIKGLIDFAQNFDNNAVAADDEDEEEFLVLAICINEGQQKAVFDLLKKEGVECKIM